jgi:hypothetical protein
MRGIIAKAHRASQSAYQHPWTRRIGVAKSMETKIKQEAMGTSTLIDSGFGLGIGVHPGTRQKKHQQHNARALVHSP